MSSPRHRTRSSESSCRRRSARPLIASGRIAGACAVALAAMAGGAFAAGFPAPPTANQIWGGCLLQPSTVSAIQNDILASGPQTGPNKIQSVAVAYVIVKSFEGGAKLTGNTFTSDILCRASGTTVEQLSEVEAVGPFNIESMTDFAGILFTQSNQPGYRECGAPAAGGAGNATCFGIRQTP